MLIRAWQLRARAVTTSTTAGHTASTPVPAARPSDLSSTAALGQAPRHDQRRKRGAGSLQSHRIAVLHPLRVADQICLRRDTGTLHCTLPHGRSGTLVRESVVQQSPLLVVAEIRQVSARATAPRRCSAWPRPSSWNGCGSCFPTNSPPSRSVNLTPPPSGRGV